MAAVEWALTWLPFHEVLRCQAVCLSWRDACTSPQLWKELVCAGLRLPRHHLTNVSADAALPYATRDHVSPMQTLALIMSLSVWLRAGVRWSRVEQRSPVERDDSTHDSAAVRAAVAVLRRAAVCPVIVYLELWCGGVVLSRRVGWRRMWRVAWHAPQSDCSLHPTPPP